MSWMLVVGALFLAGSLCYAVSATPAAEKPRKLVHAGGWVLWALAGLVSAVEVLVAAKELGAVSLSKLDVGQHVASIVMGALFAYAAVALLGVTGFWVAVKRRLRRDH